MKTLLVVLSFGFTFSTYSQSELTPFYNNDNRLWGYKNSAEEVIFEAQFKIARTFSEGVAFVQKCEDKWAPCADQFIDNNGKTIFNVPKHLVVFSANQFLSEGLIAVYNKRVGHYGFVSIKGEEVIPFEFQMAYNFSEGKAVVINCEEEEQADNLGESILVEKCEMVVIDKTRDVVLEIPDSLFNRWGSTDYISPLEFREGLLRVNHKETGKAGFIDPEGHLVIPCMYDTAGNFSEGLAFACTLTNTFMEQVGDNIIGYIDRRNNLRIQLPKDLANLDNGCYFSGGSFKSGRAKMQILENDGDCVNWGFIVINSEGAVIINDWK